MRLRGGLWVGIGCTEFGAATFGRLLVGSAVEKQIPRLRFAAARNDKKKGKGAGVLAKAKVRVYWSG
jgi:hypothetical protein